MYYGNEVFVDLKNIFFIPKKVGNRNGVTWLYYSTFFFNQVNFLWLPCLFLGLQISSINLKREGI
ncbi:Putative membrane protein [Zobellia galactanivorans]|uniref:Putative membrane protein n=1 Tax=Zobellia galactanivorans (strain DSM 12802 / CCUG 47099 / CIP 106680 / NCIMB 13871 / Dsij) TaxID=63186 RepID=G0L2R8_ZOBGA|nr:hypothetical protein B4Q04_00555 [Zobellia sp. OII3]CAZ95151.1 Putative membrane protein [Zobellia galactanivorans]